MEYFAAIVGPVLIGVMMFTLLFAVVSVVLMWKPDGTYQALPESLEALNDSGPEQIDLQYRPDPDDDDDADDTDIYGDEYRLDAGHEMPSPHEWKYPPCERS